MEGGILTSEGGRGIVTDAGKRAGTVTVEGGRGIVTDAGKRAGTVTVEREKVETEGEKGEALGCGAVSYTHLRAHETG